LGMKGGWWIWIFCSLLASAFAADVEKQEMRVALEELRKENAELHRVDLVRQREMTSLTNELARMQVRLGNPRTGLIADDEEVRASEEWRSFLQNALKILSDADREMQGLRRQLRQLVFVSQEAFRTAEKVDPSKRAQLEGEIRQSQKLLTGSEEPKVFAPEPEPTALENIKVAGVRLDLGVAALVVGRNQGARVGMPFVIVRGKTVMAVARLVEVREKISLALIEQMDAEKPIREGDLASLRKT